METETQIKSLEEAKVLTQKLPWNQDNIGKLEKDFHKLAKYFLYGGYISVSNRYNVYIQRVEFYFHSEVDNPDAIKDDIVYHRNDYLVDGKLPYYSPFTFNAHTSGFDIAFENIEKQYRASVLIRAYEIYDTFEKKFLIHTPKSEQVIDKKTGKIVNVDKGKFLFSDAPQTNTQSTYLNRILNGFGDTGDILWIHNLSSLYMHHKDLILKAREGVYKGAKWQDSKYDKPRERKWSFERQEFIPLN